MKARFITFGCRLNRAEALEDEAKFLADGWEIADKNEAADIYVVRGCSVTARAQRDCEKTIAAIKRRHPLASVIVRGCLPGSIDDSVRPLPRMPAGTRKRGKTPAVPSRTARAYLKVQDGCSGNCSFCIVPRFRGKSRSEEFGSLTGRAARFIDAGYREIVVTGCNLSLYASEGKRLDGLLAHLAGLDRSVRIRLGSLEPGPVARDTVHVIAENPNICRFLHIPVQSGSAKILEAMKRPYTPGDVEEIASLASSLVPDISLGCDMMAGFPGESRSDFTESVRLLERCRFTNIHSFAYSERPGTAAASLPAAIPPQLRSARAKRLAEAVETQRKRFARSFIGKRVEVLVEDERKSAGWTSQYLWFEASHPVPENGPGRRRIAEFLVREARECTLRGMRV